MSSPGVVDIGGGVVELGVRPRLVRVVEKEPTGKIDLGMLKPADAKRAIENKKRLAAELATKANDEPNLMRQNALRRRSIKMWKEVVKEEVALERRIKLAAVAKRMEVEERRRAMEEEGREPSGGDDDDGETEIDYGDEDVDGDENVDVEDDVADEDRPEEVDREEDDVMAEAAAEGEEIYEEKMVNVAQQDLSRRFGLPLKENRLVSHKIKEVAFPSEIVYEDTVLRVKGRYGYTAPKGRPPVIMELTPGAMMREPEEMDDDESDELRAERAKMGMALPDDYRKARAIPSRVSKRGSGARPLRVGNYVAFTMRGKRYIGRVLDLGDEGATVLYGHASVLPIRYDRLTVVDAPGVFGMEERRIPELLKISDKKDAETILAQHPPRRVRDAVITSYIDMVRPLVKGGAEKSTATIVEVLPEPPSWEDFYQEALRQWAVAKHYSELSGQIDQRQISVRAAAEAKKDVELYTDPSVADGILDRIERRLPDGRMDRLTNASDMITAILSIGDPDIVDINILTALYKIPPQTSYPYLAYTVRDAIERSLRPTDIELYRRMIQGEEVRKLVREYRPTEEDIAEFDEHHLDTLKGAHNQSMREYERSKLVATSTPIAPESTFSADTSGPTLAEFTEQIRKFEAEAYAAAGGERSILVDYLEIVLQPSIFLSGILAPHAKIFRAKLSNGDYPFSSLIAANLAHYLPELVMSVRRDDNKMWNRIEDALTGELNQRVVRYTMTIDPTLRIVGGFADIQRLTLEGGAALADMIKLTPAEICELQTASGKRRIAKNGEVVEEDIPAEDIVLCYKDGKFKCYSTQEVLLAISKDPINPIDVRSGKPYPRDFVERMRFRVGDDTYDPEKDAEQQHQIFVELKKALAASTRADVSVALMGKRLFPLTAVLGAVDVPTIDGLKEVDLVTDPELADAVILEIDYATSSWLDSYQAAMEVLPKDKPIYVVVFGAEGEKKRSKRDIKKKLNAIAKPRSIDILTGDVRDLEEIVVATIKRM